MSARRILVVSTVAATLLVVPSAVADAPVLGLSDITVNVNGVTSTTVSWGYAASDGEDGTIPVSCSPSSGSTFSLGSTTVSCEATDSVGDSANGSFTVTVEDTTPPAVSVPGGQTINVNGVSSATFSYTATASDGPVALTPSCSPSGTTFPLGTTTVTCSATDLAGNTGSASFDVTVSDTTPPTVSVPANIAVTINNATSATVAYTATAADGPTPLAPSCSPASGSSFPLGVTTVACTATDAAGNAATPKSFTVTVSDTTPPAVAITSGPGSTSNSRTAAFGFTTSEGRTACQLDGGGFSPCGSPASYGGLADGSHTFTVRATDAAGNSASASRSWRIDATPPVLSLPSTIYAEADGPKGAVVGFTVGGSDAGTPLLPSQISCEPGIASLFPLGRTTVICRAADAFGNVAAGSFDVIVQDTTPPAINAPNVSFTATSSGGIRKSDPDVAQYLAGVSATDLVSTATLTNDMPDVLPIGRTTVTFSATDAALNVATKAVVVTVLPVGQKAPPPDLTPPGDVVGAAAKPGDRLVVLTWKRVAKDVAYVTVTELVAGETGVGQDVYRGTGPKVTVKGLRNGTAYRFLIVTWDAAGNRSKGIVVLATPKVEVLASPLPGEHVSRPPLLRWAGIPGATYFNVQLWRGSEKVLSTWPTAPRYQLSASWTYAGKARKLTPGTYTWYVWPGLGERSTAHYGALLGSRTFVVTKAKRTKR